MCVLVQGAAWQFKGWEWDQPVTLFQNGERASSLVVVHVSFPPFGWPSLGDVSVVVGVVASVKSCVMVLLADVVLLCASGYIP